MNGQPAESKCIRVCVRVRERARVPRARMKSMGYPCACSWRFTHHIFSRTIPNINPCPKA